MRPKKTEKSNKIVVILGQTATGKSDMAVVLAKKFGGEVVSADSRQVYKGLDLGTGKITKKEMSGVPHHLLDIANPKRKFSVAQYKRKAEKAIDSILARGKLPILCGGTGFYIQAIVDNAVFPEVSPDAGLRKRLGKKSAEELFIELKKLDPIRASEIDGKNKVRLVRAIEIATKLGSVPKIKHGGNCKYNALQIGLKVPEKTLYKNTENRIYKRVRLGMIAEVKRLHQNGLSWNRMEELGLEYRYISQHLRGLIDKGAMLSLLNTTTRQFAKRQATWFKRDKRIKWFTPTQTKIIEKEVRKFI